jgi:hypothetical protein
VGVGVDEARDDGAPPRSRRSSAAGAAVAGPTHATRPSATTSAASATVPSWPAPRAGRS